MPSRCNPVPYCRIHCRALLSCTVLPNAAKLRRTAESLLCYAGKLCRGNSYVPRLCETRLRQKRNKNEKSTHVRKSDPINSESHTRHSRNHPCPTPFSRKNIGPSPQRYPFASRCAWTRYTTCTALYAHVTPCIWSFFEVVGMSLSRIRRA